MTNDAFENAPTRPADDAGHGDSPCESAGFFAHTDLLISRVVDGAATSQDWAALEEAAAADPSLWRDLAGAQREHALLTRQVRQCVQIAAAVQLPAAAAAKGAHPLRSSATGPARSGAAWTGWLVAAALALAGAVGWLRPHMAPTSTTTGPVTAAGWSVNNSDEAVEAYLTLGAAQDRVLGEVPQRILLDSRPLEGGQHFEVVYIRRFVERAKVEDLLRFDGAVDEAGRPVGIPVSTLSPVTTEQDQPWSG